MKETMYTKIYNSVYKKAVLESTLLNLEKLSERIGTKKKFEKGELEEVLEKTITQPLLKKLLLGEIQNNNLSIFNTKELQKLISQVQEITNITKIVDITMALPLTEPDLQDIVHQLESKINKKVILNLKVDPSLIGGVVVKENKYIFDSSLRNHLKDYENEWVKSLRKTHRQEDKEEVAKFENS